MYSYDINGKRVAFKSKLPLRDSRDLPALIDAIKPDNYDSQIGLLMKIVDSWEFTGRPDEPQSYEDMDVLSELTPMVNAAGEYLRAKLGTNPN